MSNKEETTGEPEINDNHKTKGNSVEGEKDEPESEVICDEDVNEQKSIKMIKDEKQELEKKLEVRNDQYLREHAECENFKKRLLKETDDRIKFANKNFVSDLLPVLDHLEMAVSHITPSSPVESLREGVRLTLQQFNDILGKYGITNIEAKTGNEFDPSLHEAMMVEHNSDICNNAITKILQKGYLLSGRVLRPVKVAVNKNEKIKNISTIEEVNND